MRALNWIFSELGFIGILDFLVSCFGFMVNKYSLILSIFLGMSLNSLVGIEPAIFLTIFTIFILEIVTGIIASVVIKKEKFDKEKLTRSMIKLVAYPLLLAIIHQLTTFEITNISFFDFNIDIFEITYNALIILIVIQVLISLLENFSAMGFKELDIIVNLFRKKLKNIEKDIENKEK